MNLRLPLSVVALAAAFACASEDAAADVPSAATSTVDPCIAVCPAGDMTLHVVVRDLNAVPVPGAVVTVNFCSCPGLYFCPLAGGEPYTISNGCLVSMVANSVGVVDIPIRAGGTCDGGTISVFANGYPLAVRTVVSSPDQNGDGVVDVVDRDILVYKRLVTPFDLTGDLDCSGSVDVTDLVLIVSHVLAGHQCASGNTFEAPQLRVNVLGPTLMRGNRTTPFDLVIENRSSVVAVGVPLWVAGVPTGASVSLDFPLAYPPQESGEPAWTSAPLTFTSTGGRYLALVIPRIPPGTITRRINLHVPVSVTSFQLTAAVAPQWTAGGPLGGCLTGGGVITDPECMEDVLTAFNAFLNTNPSLQAVSGIALWAKVAWQCEGAANLPAALTQSEQVLDLMVQPVEQGTTSPSCGVPLLPRWRETLAVSVVSAIDPNDKLGTHGSLSGQQILPYTIRFENLSSATAPAQQVIVTDALDPATIDDATVSLDAITFGNVRVSPPPGLTSYSTTVDLRPANDLLVEVSASLDLFTHVLTWLFRSIDPATGQPPINPLAGFLPPNLVPPEGEGSLLFTVMPKDGLTTGAQISNAAAIIFDDPPGLNTPPWQNSVDNTPPASHVVPFTTPQDPGRPTVQWTKDGTPTDLKDYTIYIQRDTAPYTAWRINTVATSDTFNTEVGHTYRFYSIARDLSSNIEAPPAGPDAVFTPVVGVEARGTPNLALAGARPNPARGALRVWFTLASDEPATLELYDLTGRRLARRAVGTLGAGEHEVALGPSAELKAGLYFLRLTQGSRVLHARAAVMR